MSSIYVLQEINLIGKKTLDQVERALNRKKSLIHPQVKRTFRPRFKPTFKWVAKTWAGAAVSSGKGLGAQPPPSPEDLKAVILSLSSGLTDMGVRGNVFRSIEWPCAFRQLGSRLGIEIDNVRIRSDGLNVKVVSVEPVKFPATSLGPLGVD